MFFFGAYKYMESKRVLQAFCYDEVIECLRIMKLHAKRKKKGYYVGYMTYECALLLQDSLYKKNRAQTRSNAPLLYFELFLQRKKWNPKHTKKIQKKLFAITTPLDKARYEKDFARIKESIQAGHTYQVNYTQEIQLRPLLPLDSFSYFTILCSRQNTAYRAYIANKYMEILSFSPELFFHFQKHKITTQPMKGTMKRGIIDKGIAQKALLDSSATKKIPCQKKGSTDWNLYKLYKKGVKKHVKSLDSKIDRVQDFYNLKTLYYDSKNRSENVMIVDLLRNDISRIAKQGSVRVTELFAIHSYPTLHQMVSTIEAKLPRSYGIFEILKALFPCGSITGAPKYKTTAIISELERRERSVYCGAIGVVGAKESIFSIPIRTLYRHNGESAYRYGVGSGVVWDSKCEEEFLELGLKCRFLTESRL